MAGSRRQGREAALQILYLTDLCPRLVNDVPEAAWSEGPLPSKTRVFAVHLVKGVASQIDRIDAVIKKYAENWEIGRMATVDRCLLRMATFELISDHDTPVNVIINEAIEIVKVYSTAESSRFVNGILDKVKQER